MEVTEELTVWPCGEDDRGTQRCRLGPALMDRLHIKIGSCVEIKYQARTFICNAWPRQDRWNQAIQFDESAYVTNTPGGRPTGLSPVGSDLLPVSSLHPTETVKLNSLDISIVFVRLSDVLQFEKNKTQGQGQARFQKQVTDILKKIYVHENMHLNCKNIPLGNLYGISRIIINKTKHLKDGGVCGSVSSQTSVKITSVLSKERYDLTQDRTPISVGGLDSQLKSLKDIISFSTTNTKFAKQIGITWPKGIFIRGPAGSGKTSLVRKCAIELNISLLECRGSELLGSRPGEGEEKLRKLFQKATMMSEEAPCAILIEDIDSLCSKIGKGGSGNTQERRMVAQLVSLLDNISKDTHVVVVATSSKPQVVDPTLLTSGRLEKEIFIGFPSCTQRREILHILLAGCNLYEDVDLDHLAEATPGFVGADLKSLVDQAQYLAATDSVDDFRIKGRHLLQSLHTVVPSAQRGSDVIVDHQPVSWDDIGGLEDVIKQIKQAVEWPLKHGSAFARLGIPRPGGLLLYGPPGCAKTLLVRAAACACKVTFLAVSGAQLNSPFVGDAERKLTEIFRQARENAPSILFLDEVDAVVGKRKEGKGQGGAHERVLSTLLNEMDGVGLRLDELVRNKPKEMMLEQESTSKEPTQDDVGETDVDNSGVLVVAATNRPDMIDAALMRPGRLDKIIYVPPPDEKARTQILSVHTRKMPCKGIDLSAFSRLTAGFTGADLENLCREAALNALTRKGLDTEEVVTEDFQTSLSKMKPSLTSEQLTFYEKLISRHR